MRPKTLAGGPATGESPWHDSRFCQPKLPLRVLIVSPDALYRDCLSVSLAAETDFAVHAVAASPSEALQAALCHEPELLVLDAASSSRTIADLIERAGHFRPGARVVLVGQPVARHPAGLSARSAAPYSCLSGSAGLSALQGLLRHFVFGEESCSPAAGRPRRGAAAAREPILTPREVEILSLVSRGLSNKEISKRLHISLGTVKNHVHNVLDKLGVSGRYAAIATLRGRGWRASNLDR